MPKAIMTRCEYCGRVFESTKQKCDHHRYCKSKRTQVIKPVKKIKLTLRKKPSNDTKSTPPTVNIHVDNINVNNVHIDKIDVHQHYTIVVSERTGELLLENEIRKIGQGECLARLCQCGRCASIRTQSNLDTSITQMNHSADRLIEHIFELGLIKLVERMPVAQSAHSKHLYYGGQRQIATRIKECVESTESDKNLKMLHSLGIYKENDVYANREKLIDALPRLVPMIESQRRMGDVCSSSFRKSTPDKYSSRRTIVGSELKSICN